MTTQQRTHKFRDESRILKAQILTLERRRVARLSRLRHFLNKLEYQLQEALDILPEFNSAASQHKFGEYKRAVELLTLQIHDTSQKISNEIQRPIMPLLARPVPGARTDIWVEYIEDLQDAHEEQRSHWRQDQKRWLLSLVEILDTLERITSLEIPEVNNPEEEEYSDNLKYLLWKTGVIRHTLTTSLSDRGVIPIELKIGDYPSPGVTRITAREDNEKTDNIVVSKILEKGYRWRGDFILRKTNITVKTGD